MGNTPRRAPRVALAALIALVTSAKAAAQTMPEITGAQAASAWPQRLRLTTLVGPPSLTTPTSSQVTLATATLGGNVTSDNTVTITDRGVVFAPTATNADPQIGGSGVTRVSTAGTTGVFALGVTSLTSPTAYSFRAYATNAEGTGYTPIGTFMTLAQIAVYAGNFQSATVGSAVGTPPAVIVRDAGGSPMAGVLVTFSGDGIVTGAAQTTSVAGIATVGSWTLSATAGINNNLLTATSAGLTGSPVTFTASAVAEAAGGVILARPWVVTGGLNATRYHHSSVLMRDGRVMVLGGVGTTTGTPFSTEFFDPRTGRWVRGAGTNGSHVDATATVLADGRVLVVGGSSAETYDLRTGVWTLVPTNPAGARVHHTATLLPNGKVLIVGGRSASLSPSLARADLFDPISMTWTQVADIPGARAVHTATLLADGRVLVVGGTSYLDQFSNGTALDTAYLFDSASGTWTAAWEGVSRPTARRSHAAVRLVDGRVLVCGGGSDAISFSSCDIYDPTVNSWSAGPAMAAAREEHRAVLLSWGQVLVIGGYRLQGPYLSDVEVYDPGRNDWAPVAPLTIGRARHTAVILPSGMVLVSGGYNGSLIAPSELFDPMSGYWGGDAAPALTHQLSTATRLPDGGVLVAGGTTTWWQTPSGILGNDTPTNGSERYDPLLRAWRPVGPLGIGRSGHTATLLPDGRVLATGGLSAVSASTPVATRSAEVFDSATRTWSPASLMANPRANHRATLLRDGRVLVTGGFNTSYNSGYKPPEIYDYRTDTWSGAGVMAANRINHSATLLQDGRVLVVGGRLAQGDFFSSSSCELYDPATNAWTQGPSLTFPRQWHTATLLADGRVLVAGGLQGLTANASVATSEIFDPVSGTWSLSGVMQPGFSDEAAGRYFHAAALLPNGKVMVTGGMTVQASVHRIVKTYEFFDPRLGTWSREGSTPDGQWRGVDFQSVLEDGRVLIAGSNDTGFIFSAGLEPRTVAFEVNPVSAGRWPVVTCVGGSPACAGVASHEDAGGLLVTGTGFRGGAEAAGGTAQQSPANLSVLEVRRLDHSDALLPIFATDAAGAPDSEPKTLLAPSLPAELDPGWYDLTVSVAGVRSVARPLQVGCSLAITSQPSNQTVVLGTRATFGVTTAGAIGFQWERDRGAGWETLSGAAGLTYETDPVSGTDAGTRYRVVASRPCKTVTSGPAILFVSDSVGPTVVVQSPAGGERFPVGSQQRVLWTAVDTVRVCKAAASLEYSNNGGGTWAPAAAAGGLPFTVDRTSSCLPPGLGPAESQVTYAVPAAFPSGQPGSLYRVRVQAWDLNGNASAIATSGVFYIVKPDPEAQTLILWNRDRMQSQLGSAVVELDELARQLGNLAGHERVRGVVEDVGSIAPLTVLYAKWDAAHSGNTADQHNWANTILFGCDRASASESYPGWCGVGEQGIDGLQDLVTARKRTLYANLKYVIVVGDDRVIPFARLLDETSGNASESRYLGGVTPDLTPATTAGRALAANRYLSDDPLLTDAVIRPDDLSGLFRPDFSGGRLVERADEIIKTISTFMGQDGVMDLTAEPVGHRVLVTGYDFMLAGASGIRSKWEGVPGVGPVAQTLLGESWGDALLRLGLSGNGSSRYGVMSLNGHASHFLEGVPAAGAVSGLNALDVYGTDRCANTSASPLNANFDGAVVYSMGCHGGLVVPGSCSSTSDHSLDLPQTFLSRGAAVYLGNTGYGYGDWGVVAYSMLLSDLFTQRLVGEQSIAIGDAVRLTKSDSYLRDRGGISDPSKPGRISGLDAYDRKILQQWTLFGMPMYELRLRTGTQSISAAAPSLVTKASDSSTQDVGSVRVNRSVGVGSDATSGGLAAGPDLAPTPNVIERPPQYVTKLSLQFDLSAQDVYTKWHLGTQLPSNSTDCPNESDPRRQGCYYRLNNKMTTGSGMPVQPMMVYDSRLSGTSQHGVLWMGGTYVEETGWKPVFGGVVTNGFENSEPLPAPRTVYSDSIATQTGSSRGGCRASDDEVNSMAIPTGQLLRDDVTHEFTIERHFVNFDAEVLYYNNTNPAQASQNCGRTGPGLSEGGGLFAGGAYHHVTGQTMEWAVPGLPGNVWRVVVVYNDEANSVWEPLELVKDVAGVWRGSKLFTGATRVGYLLQAVDTKGNVGRLRFEDTLPNSGIERSFPLVVDATIPAPVPSTLLINDVTWPEGNAGVSNAMFTVTLSAASAQAITVSAMTSDLSANAGSDYTATGPTTLTFAPGITVQTFSVPVSGDTTSESTETFQVTLSSPTNATILDGVGIGTITNDDAVPPARVFVSTTGNDANNCSLQTTPCRNLAAALDQVAIDGEVIVLESGDYAAAPFSITRGVKISSPSGTVAFVRQPITVNAPGARVVLRGLTIKGAGTGNAVTLAAGDSLAIEGTTIDSWSVGLRLANSVPSRLTISTSVFTANGAGLNDTGAAPGNRVSVEETRFEGNVKGIEILAGGCVVRESAFVGNTGSGVVAGPGSVDIQRSEFSLNGVGVSALSGGTVRMSRSMVFGNTTGLSAEVGSSFVSTGRNVIRRNGTNSTGTIAAAPEQ